MSVYKKLNEARVKFHSLELKKTGHNKFAGYYYFELGDFLTPALKVFNEVGLCAIVSFDSERANMQIIPVDWKPGESVITITSPMGSAALKGCHEVQNIGAVETYQRRYLWVAALEIVEHDALDATTGKEKEDGNAAKAPKKEAVRTTLAKYVQAIQDHIANERDLGVLQAYDEAWDQGEEFAASVWNSLTTPQREYITRLQNSKAKKAA